MNLNFAKRFKLWRDIDFGTPWGITCRSLARNTFKFKVFVLVVVVVVVVFVVSFCFVLGFFFLI